MAMAAVMAAERELGFKPKDVSAAKCGWDIESAIPGTGLLRLLEVKGRIRGAETVTISKNEILAAFNKPDSWILVLVEVPPDGDFVEGDLYRGVKEGQVAYNVASECRVRYVRQPFTREPDFGVTSVNYDWRELWNREDCRL
jgi:hypothetical protein